jgi:hypothetical protein
MLGRMESLLDVCGSSPQKRSKLYGLDWLISGERRVYRSLSGGDSDRLFDGRDVSRCFRQDQRALFDPPHNVSNADLPPIRPLGEHTVQVVYLG